MASHLSDLRGDPLDADLHRTLPRHPTLNELRPTSSSSLKRAHSPKLIDAPFPALSTRFLENFFSSALSSRDGWSAVNGPSAGFHRQHSSARGKFDGHSMADHHLQHEYEFVEEEEVGRRQPPAADPSENYSREGTWIEDGWDGQGSVRDGRDEEVVIVKTGQKVHL